MAKTEILSKIGVGSGLNTTELIQALVEADTCLLYTSPSPRDLAVSRMPSSA